jgi:hypothetical protein
MTSLVAACFLWIGVAALVVRTLILEARVPAPASSALLSDRKIAVL